jgi:hypothetical protein
MGLFYQVSFISLPYLVTGMAMNKFSTLIIKAIAVPIEVLMSGCFENSLSGYSEKVLQIFTVYPKQK